MLTIYHLSLHFLRKAWHRFANTFHVIIFGEPAPTPWMLLEEADIIRDVLTRLQPTRCLEYGAGYSTLHFPTNLSAHACWLSVEHVGTWADKVENHARFPGNASILRVPVSEPGGFAPPPTEGESFADYVAAPKSQGPFDFVLIDGHARNECVAAAFKMLRRGGIVILHDANRAEYREATVQFEHQISFLGRGTDQLGIWIGRFGMPVEEVLDVAWHRRVWDFCERWHKAFNCRTQGL
jgi:predicted O-methyltransferase YrrM